MSHDTFQKSKREEVLKMLKWVKEGLSFSEIGRRLHKDHATIMYWIKKIGPDNIFAVKNILPENVKIEVCKKEKTEEKIDCCAVCHKEKDRRWKKTAYCGTKCYGSIKKRETELWY